MTNHHYDNSERLEGVSEQDWREALDELTAYLTWRLRGKTAKGAHSEKVLGMSCARACSRSSMVKAGDVLVSDIVMGMQTLGPWQAAPYIINRDDKGVYKICLLE